MALRSDNTEKLNHILEKEPNVTIFLKPIAAPAALGLAGFAGSTWITASYIAGWWGNSASPTIFFPFVAFWGGLAQFIAGLYGYPARDVLVTVIHCMWGSFWMSIGLLYLLVVRSSPVPEGRSRYTFVLTCFLHWLCSDRGSITSPWTPRTFSRTRILVRHPSILHMVRRKSSPLILNHILRIP